VKNINAMNTATAQKTDPQTETILNVLTQFQDDIKRSQVFLEFGIDTALVRRLRQFLGNTSEGISQLSKEISAVSGLLLLLEIAHKAYRLPFVNTIYFKHNQNSLSIWIILKPWSQRNRFRIYEITREVMSKDEFSPLSCDFAVLGEKHLDTIPSGFQELSKPMHAKFQRTLKPSEAK
jgi:hypothetical protein